MKRRDEQSNLPTRTVGQHTPLHAASQTNLPSYSSQNTSYLPSAPVPSYGGSASASQSYAGGSAFFDAPGASGAAGASRNAYAPPVPVVQQQGGQGGQQRETNDGRTVQLGNGERIGLEEARQFMDYYCAWFFLSFRLLFSFLSLERREGKKE
jgi:hypothetical protein